ncbi:methyl-accepting chemotaxis protein [Pseudoduganella sp. HUAS MS19]
MIGTWTFGRKLAAGYAAMALLALLISVVAIVALRTAVAGQERVINVNAQVMLDVERCNGLAERMSANVRGYLLSPERRFFDNYNDARSEFFKTTGRIRSLLSSAGEQQALAEAERSANGYREAAERVLALADSRPGAADLVRAFDDRVLPARETLAKALAVLDAQQEQQLEAAKREAADLAASAAMGVTVLAVALLLLAIGLAVLLSRTLGRQIGAAVGHVQSSSAELQAAASQQASGAKEQAGAMSEISTTISELVATSRQIAESAQRVAQIAEQTAQGARAGDGIVGKGQEAIAGIRRQIDTVVSHMLDLGRKSQEIGAVLDIVSELAEQTNILAINATIEASGAGESGKRFAVVAEEIRKLADRVAASTKGIRSQIEDVRGAVNTTVMATEGGAKAVDAGARQFADVAAAFRQIADLVVTTTEAAREIELSTKQQASAAEQVRIAVTDVAQATQETEASSAQTLQTASQLASLSLDLRRLVQPQASAA